MSDPKLETVIVNGITRAVSGRALEYADVVHLAGKTGAGWAITWRCDDAGGTLEPGDALRLRRALVLNVAKPKRD